MSKGKETSASWPSASTWEGVVSVLDSCGLSCKHWDAPRTPAGLMYLFEKPHYRKAEKFMAAAVGWSLLWAVRLTTDAQLEAQAKGKN